MTDTEGMAGIKLEYRCAACGQPVAAGTGYIHVSTREAARVQEADREWQRAQDADWEAMTRGEPHNVGNNLSSFLALPDSAQWQVHHEACDDTDDDGYWFDVGRADTHEKLLSWTAHLMGKTWIEYTDWPEFLYTRAISREAASV
jgi:hypothetical protein